MGDSGGTWRLGHRPALDALRGLAVLMVMAGHAWRSPRRAGWCSSGAAPYALYLWSTPLAFGMLLTPLRGHLSDWIAVTVYMAVSWAAATASWYLVERPLLGTEASVDFAQRQ